MTPNQILQGDALEVLRTLPSNYVQCVVTSPPYYNLRDYGMDGQIGLEETPQGYAYKLVSVFREVRRVLRDDGTLWLNLGDSFLPGKQLGGIPWSVAKALQQPYYTGKIDREIDRVWLAATIDAEGSISGFTSVRKDTGAIRTGIHITITNTNKALLDNAHRIWKTTRSDHNLHGRGHMGSLDTYRWIAHDEKSLLMREMYPYLIAKKKQSLLAWNFLELSSEAKHIARTPEAQEVKDKRSWLVHALSRLNHFEDVDIPTWCKEPPSLQADGWILRQDICWFKTNAMPESVKDRCTKAHEYVFLLAKNERYFYDAEAIKVPAKTPGRTRTIAGLKVRDIPPGDPNYRAGSEQWGRSTTDSDTRNARSVWPIATTPFPGAHFAVMAPELARQCILAGSSDKACERCGTAYDRQIKTTYIQGKTSGKGNRAAVGDITNPTSIFLTGLEPRTCTIGFERGCMCDNIGSAKSIVLDPFSGAGTTAYVASKLGRQYIGIELNPEYVELSKKRLAGLTAGLWGFDEEIA